MTELPARMIYSEVEGVDVDVSGRADVYDLSPPPELSMRGLARDDLQGAGVMDEPSPFAAAEERKQAARAPAVERR
jgi:hypothetical protein